MNKNEQNPHEINNPANLDILGDIQFILMHKDEEVAKTTAGSITDNWEILQPNLLPSTWNALRKIPETPLSSQNQANLDKAETEREMLMEINRNIILQWLAYRVLPFDRLNAKKLHQILDISQENTRTMKASISLQIMGLSICDNYWIKKSNQEISWKNVDIKQNPISEGLAVLALLGKTSAVTAADLANPLLAAAELSTLGSYAKGVFREGEHLYLYKTGDNHTLAAEVVSSAILAASNVYGLVKYEYQEKLNTPAVKCKLMTTPKRDVLHANFFDGNAVSFAQQNFAEQFYQMCVVDYLIGNIDRHGINWGFFREHPNWEITGLHWLYDHNNAFDIDELNEKSQAKSVLGQDSRLTRSNIGLEEAAIFSLKRCNFRFHSPILKQNFKLFGKQKGKAIKMFTKRCEKLGIKVKIK
ncbi:MAG: hypothetical protein FWG64_04570 [Firmicutes bacterium]|nr:hypothetical protein [Bacillota bacterium]